MKKCLCFLMTIVLLLCVIATAASVSAEDILTVHTADGKTISVPVGSEFEYITHLYSGEVLLRDGQGYVTYDSALMQPVPTRAYDELVEGNTIYGYSMPRINDGKRTINYATEPGFIYFNFSNTDGFVAFTIDQPFFVYRFKALQAGETILTTTIEYMNNELKEHVYFKCFPNEIINPYTAFTLNDLTPQPTSEPSTAPSTAESTAPSAEESTAAPSSAPSAEESTAAPSSAPSAEESTVESSTSPSSETVAESTAASSSEEETADDYPYELGDANTDKLVDIMDVTSIQRHLAKLVTLSEKQQALGDTDRNGFLDILDATKIQKYLAKIIEEL